MFVPLRRLQVCLGIALAASGAHSASQASETGQTLAFQTEHGNCLACHYIAGGEQMGDIGPPLVNMRERFPDRARLYTQIWDASAFNIDTLMPPYGRQQILSPQEINAIIDFLYQK